MLRFNHREILDLAQSAAYKIGNEWNPNASIYGVPRGGVPVAYAIHAAGMRTHPSFHFNIVSSPSDADVIVDDIIDSGTTRAYFDGWRFLSLTAKGGKGREHDKTWAVFHDIPQDEWVTFPWEGGETDQSASDIPTRLLQYIGEDVTREGLKETPKRFLGAWAEYTTGYKRLLDLKSFSDGAENCGDEIVLVSNIPVYSHCEHHLAPFWGLAHVGYLPNSKILGLSKFARLVEVFSRRLQVQERLTNQIANALNDELQPHAVGVILECRHMCMESRGVRARGSVTTTSALRGLLKTEDSLRHEFMQLVLNASTTKHGL